MIESCMVADPTASWPYSDRPMISLRYTNSMKGRSPPPMEAGCPRAHRPRRLASALSSAMAAAESSEPSPRTGSAGITAPSMKSFIRVRSASTSDERPESDMCPPFPRATVAPHRVRTRLRRDTMGTNRTSQGAAMTLADIDLLDLDRFQRGEHHEMFKQLRREAPVYWHDHPTGQGFWNVVRHEDLVAVNRDAATYSSEAGGVSILGPDEMPDGQSNDPRGVMMLYMDAPKHT